MKNSFKECDWTETDEECERCGVKAGVNSTVREREYADKELGMTVSVLCNTCLMERLMEF